MGNLLPLSISKPETKLQTFILTQSPQPHTQGLPTTQLLSDSLTNLNTREEGSSYMSWRVLDCHSPDTC